MSVFRVIAVVLFVVATVLVAVGGSLLGVEPLGWIAAGLAAFAMSGASFDRSL